MKREKAPRAGGEHIETGGFVQLGGTRALLDATAEELRVLLCIFGGARADEEAVSELAALAGCSEARAKSALTYWREVGVLIPAEELGETVGTADEPTPVYPEEMTGDETAATIRDLRLHKFLDACQQLAGRLFNKRELTKLTALVCDMPFSEEYLLMLANYCNRMTDKFSVAYMERVAQAMLEKQVLTPEALNAYLANLERFAKVEWKLRKLFGLGERALTKQQSALFEKWTGEYGYDEKVIGIAYDITVDRTDKISYKYMDALLTRFHGAGCHSVAEVEEFLDRERAEHAQKPISQHTGAAKPTDTPQKGRSGGGKRQGILTPTAASFDAEDFFAAALRRSYGDEGLPEENGTDETK